MGPKVICIWNRNDTLGWLFGVDWGQLLREVGCSATGKEESTLGTESQVGLLAVGDCDCFKTRMIEGKLGRKY